MIVRHGDRRRSGAEQHVVVLEERLPGAAQQVARACRARSSRHRWQTVSRTHPGDSARVRTAARDGSAPLQNSRRSGGRGRPSAGRRRHREGRGRVDSPGARGRSTLAPLLGEEIGRPPGCDPGPRCRPSTVGSVEHHGDLEARGAVCCAAAASASRQATRVDRRSGPAMSVSASSRSSALRASGPSDGEVRLVAHDAGQ